MADQLNVLFPQWQGGKNRLVYDGALQLAASLGKKIELDKINIDLTAELALAQNIIGYDVIFNQLKQAVDLIARRNPSKVLTIGGDCSVSLAPVAYLNECFDHDLGVVWLDAHADINSPEESISKSFHGMPLRFLLGEGEEHISKKLASRLLPQQVVLAGTRDVDQLEAVYIKAKNISMLNPSALAEAPHAVADLLAARGYSNIYVHIDTDVLDPGQFSFSGYPAAPGISQETLEATINALKARFTIAGFSVVEFLPFDLQGLRQLERILAMA